MKDKLYVVLAFVGIIILSIVYWFNRDTTNSEVSFDIIDSYYITADQAINNGTAANELFDEMTGNRRVQCPAMEPMACSQPIYLSDIFSSYEKSLYSIQTYITDDVSDGLFDSYVKSDIITALSGNEQIAFNKTGTITMEQIKCDADIIELVAPFKFTFQNNNIDVGNSIVITNTKNNCKIVFDKVTNWFCAGVPGTETENGSGTYENDTSWEKHQGNHLTVIGVSRNSKVSGGQAGYVVGYGNKDTTVTVYKKDDDGNWIETSLVDLLTAIEQ